MYLMLAERCNKIQTNVTFGYGNMVATGNLYKNSFRRVEGKRHNLFSI